MQKGNNGVFRQLDEILYVDGYPGYQHLMSIAGDHMQMVCEVKGSCFATYLDQLLHGKINFVKKKYRSKLKNNLLSMINYIYLFVFFFLWKLKALSPYTE